MFTVIQMASIVEAGSLTDFAEFMKGCQIYVVVATCIILNIVMPVYILIWLNTFFNTITTISQRETKQGLHICVYNLGDSNWKMSHGRNDSRASRTPSDHGWDVDVPRPHLELGSSCLLL